MITCQVIGSQQYSWNLPQRRPEIPCVLTFSEKQRELLKGQKLAEEISSYLTTNSDNTDKEPKIKRQKTDCLEASLSAIDESAAGKTEYRDTIERDCKVGSSDINLQCNVVIVKDSTEQFTVSTSEDLECIRISSIVLKKSEKKSILDGERLTDTQINVTQKISS